MYLKEEKVKCVVCGNEFTTKKCLSFSFFGSPNLDGRRRDGSLYYISTTCPKCGYVASNIEEENEISKNWLNIKKQLNIGEIKNKADEFFALYKIANYSNNIEDEYYYLLYTCWADENSLQSQMSDDKKNSIIEHRNLLISLTAEIIKNKKEINKIIDYELTAVDLLRRNKRFKEAIEKADKYVASFNKIYSAIAKYQIKLCNEKSTKIGTVNDAIMYIDNLNNTNDLSKSNTIDVETVISDSSDSTIDTPTISKHGTTVEIANEQPKTITDFTVGIGTVTRRTVGSFVQRVNDPLTGKVTPSKDELPKQFCRSFVTKSKKTAKNITCPNCGTKLTSDIMFCYNCGDKLR